MNLIRPKKSLGQHFLHDPNTLRKIAGALPSSSRSASEPCCVIEIGSGTGLLTEQLLERFETVRAVELDGRAVDLLRERYSDLELIHGDVLKISWEQLLEGDQDIHVVGNLPYYITSQILFKILEHRRSIKSATIMMQKEVAQRLVASPCNKEYGILSVQVQLMSSPSILFDVAPGSFTPPPKVTSSVVQLYFDKPELQCSDENLKRVVRTAFQQRRKKLSNALAGIEPLPEDTELDYDKRAEAWPPANYEKLTALLEQDGTLA